MSVNKSNILLLIGSALVAFIIAEVVIRLVFPAPQIMMIRTMVKGGEQATEAQHETTSSPTYLSLQSTPDQGGVYFDTPAGKRIRPNIDVIIQNHTVSHRSVHIRTNSLGYRGDEISKDSGTRILFLGDSITFADYLQEEDTFVRQIERLAFEEQKSWETINAGVGAISLDNELSIFLETGLSIQPDVVVINWYLNDFHESVGFSNPLPHWMKKSYLLYYSVAIVAEIMALHKDDPEAHVSRTEIQQWKSAFEQQYPSKEGDYKTDQSAFNDLILKHFEDWGGAWSPSAWETMTPIFREFKQLSLKHQFELAIVMHPVQYQVETEFLDDEPQQTLKQLANTLDIPVLDLLPVLRKEYGDDKPALFYDQCHHTEHGSTIVAQAMYDFLSSLL